MRTKWRIAMVSLCSLTFVQQAAAMSLSEYKERVRRDGLQANQVAQEGQAARLEGRSADLIFTPSFFAKTQSVSDQALANPPLMTYDRYESTQSSLGFQQQFSFGLQAQLSYQVTKTNYINSPMSATTNLNFTDAKPVLELSLPIWKNGFGRSARAQEEVLRSSAEAQESLSEAQMTQLNIRAEMAYWRCAAAKEAVEVQSQSLKSAEGIREYVSRKARMELGENTDVVQAAALVEARKLQLQLAQNDARSAALDFNSLMNVNSDELPEQMDRMESTKALAISLDSKRPGNRADVVAAEAQAKVAQANALIAGEQVRPSLDLYGSYAANGRGDDFNKAINDVSSAHRDSKVIGIKFSMPLNLSAEADVRRGANLRHQAAQTSYQRVVFEQEVSWTDLVRKLTESKANLQLALAVENVQGRKLELEKKRLRQGRTTTYQVLLFEQDYLNSQLTRIQTTAQILTLKSQAEAYGPLKKDLQFEGSAQ